MYTYNAKCTRVVDGDTVDVMELISEDDKKTEPEEFVHKMLDDGEYKRIQYAPCNEIVKGIEESGVITNKLPLTEDCEPELNKYFKSYYPTMKKDDYIYSNENLKSSLAHSPSSSEISKR